MTIATQAFFVAYRLVECLSECDADILDGVMRIDVQVALGDDVQIDHAVARDLVEHVLEKRQAGIEYGLAVAVQVQLDTNLGLQGVTGNLRTTHDSS